MRSPASVPAAVVGCEEKVGRVETVVGVPSQSGGREGAGLLEGGGFDFFAPALIYFVTSFLPCFTLIFYLLPLPKYFGSFSIVLRIRLQADDYGTLIHSFFTSAPLAIGLEVAQIEVPPPCVRFNAVVP